MNFIQPGKEWIGDKKIANEHWILSMTKSNEIVGTTAVE